MFAIFGGCGAWGLLAVGLFATQALVTSTYGTTSGKFGWLYGGGLEQLGVQFIGVFVIAAWTCGMNWVVLLLIKICRCGAWRALSVHPEERWGRSPSSRRRERPSMAGSATPIAGI
eukprot:RCo023182